MSRVTRLSLVASIPMMLTSVAFAQNEPAPAAKPLFTDITQESGVADVVRQHKQFMVEVLAKRGDPEYREWWLSGFTLLDLDGDGSLDLHLGGHGQYATFAYNDGKGHFTKVDGKYDVQRGPQKPGQPANPDIPFPGGEIRLVYDLNEDGKLDLLTSYGDNKGQVYLNDSKPGTPPVFNCKPYDAGFDAFSRGTAMVDLNRDGIVDYLCTGDQGRRREFHTANVSFGKGDGKWEDGPQITVPKEAGAIPVDINGDGLIDLLASQRGYNTSLRWILINDPKAAATMPSTVPASHRLAFTRSLDSGLSENGTIQGVGDLNQDGYLDLICLDEVPVAPAGAATTQPSTKFQLALYFNDGKGHFTRQLVEGLRTPKMANWGGAVVTDFDNDGIADFVVNGRNFLYFFRGTGQGKFELANAQWGLPDSIGPAVDEGLCFGDIDGDGDLDVVTYAPNQNRGVAVYRNDTPTKHWLNVDLVGKKGNQGAAGSIIRILEPNTGKLLWHEQVAIWGRQSFHSYYFTTHTQRHFGLGDRQSVDTEVTFYPSGKKVLNKAVAADKTITVQED